MEYVHFVSCVLNALDFIFKYMHGAKMHFNNDILKIDQRPWVTKT